MFVADNRLSSAKSYFFNELIGSFSKSECKTMWNAFLSQKFGWSASNVLLNSDLRLSESDLLEIRSFVKRLQNNEPFQYILGEVLFHGLHLKVDYRALIPRPETEELITLIINQQINFKNIIDFCTGSGCIALALKKHFLEAKVYANDLSPQALELAQENAQSNAIDIQLECIDLFNWNSNLGFDLMVSNPPYIPQNQAIEMHENVLNFEPHLALFVDDQDPLVFYKQLVKIANSNLNSNGLMALEIHENYAQEIITLFDSILFNRLEIHKDLQGKNRMILAQKA